MAPVQQVDVLIIGSGPAGMSTALHLVKASPEWAERIVVVEKARHPREKLCGGGVTRLGEKVLTELGLSFEPAHIPIHKVRIVYQTRVFAIRGERGEPVFRVTRRDEFDHWLVQHAEHQRITVRQGEAVKAVIPYNDAVEVVTERATFHAKIVVAADGSCSFVRKALKLNSGTRKARLLEILTSEVATQQIEFHKGVAVFDFSPMLAGLQGYYWDFPNLIDGKPFMNRGIFDSRIRSEHPCIPLKQAFREALLKRKLQLDDYQLKGFPIQWFDRQGCFSRPRVLFTGDAAGVDPLFGEGISFALAYGQVAATTIIEAFIRQDFSFGEYKERVLAHPTLKQLHARAKVARIIYIMPRNPRLLEWLWKIAPLLFRGVAWCRPQYVPVNRPQMIRLV